jgi:hypothetical protein
MSLVWHQPLVRVEARQADGGWQPARCRGAPVDDSRWDVEVLHGGPERGQPGTHRYRVRWYDPAIGAGRVHRMVLLGGSHHPDVASEPFD